MTNRMLGDDTLLAGTTDASIYITLVSIDTGQLKTGLVAVDLTTASYFRQGGANSVDGTGSLNDLADIDSAHADWGFKEVDASLNPGRYRLDLPDGAVAINSDLLGIQISGPLIQSHIKDFALHTLTSDSNGAVKIQTGTGTGQLSFTSGIAAVNVVQSGGTTAAAGAIPNAAAGTNGGLPTVNAANGVLLRDGTGTGEIDLVSGKVIMDSNTADSISASSISAAAAEKIADAFLARTLGTESYAALAAIPTVKQAFFQLLAYFAHTTIGTTVHMKKLDQSTDALTFTLSPNATTPTSHLRAS